MLVFVEKFSFLADINQIKKAINKKTGEHRYYDVKFASMRKTVKKTHNPRMLFC